MSNINSGQSEKQTQKISEKSQNIKKLIQNIRKRQNSLDMSWEDRSHNIRKSLKKKNQNEKRKNENKKNV